MMHVEGVSPRLEPYTQGALSSTGPGAAANSSPQDTLVLVHRFCPSSLFGRGLPSSAR